MHEIKGNKITCAEGHLGDITFSITGPPDHTEAIVKFIRNLSRMSEGVKYNRDAVGTRNNN